MKITVGQLFIDPLKIYERCMQQKIDENQFYQNFNVGNRYSAQHYLLVVIKKLERSGTIRLYLAPVLTVLSVYFLEIE